MVSSQINFLKYVLYIFICASLFVYCLVIKHYLDKLLFVLQEFRKLSSTLDITKVYLHIIDTICAIFNPLRCSLMIVDNDGYLRIKIGRNISNYASRGFKIKPAEGIAGKALQSGKPVIVKNIAVSEHYYKMFSTEIKPVKKETIVVLPLKYQDKNFGVINLHFDTKYRFLKTKFDKLLLNSILGYFSSLLNSCNIYFEAVSDSMTKLYNHNYIVKRLQEEILLSKKFVTKLSIIMLDIDHFKKINDTYGHQVGDMVITTIANIIRDNIRLTDIAGRYGGEEFCIILPNTSLQEALVVAERLKSIICDTEIFKFSDSETLKVTCSFGVKELSYEDTAEKFISNVDELLYKAKYLGRNRICY